MRKIVRKMNFYYLCTQNTIHMSVRFTLEKRTNVHGESPIRLSWSFGGQRYQTTLGFSIKNTNWDRMKRQVKSVTHNYKGQTADDINFYIKRISLVVMSFEHHFAGDKETLTKERMKQAIKDVLNNAIARTKDIIERYVEGIEPIAQPKTTYYRDRQFKYYKFLCDAQYNHISFFILQQLFGKGERIAVPSSSCKSMKKIKGEKKFKPDYEEVDYEDVFGR